MDKARKKAVALSYDMEEGPPTIVAKGEGIIAENIISKGLEEELVIYEDSDLVSSLIKLDLNSEIPSELYDVVAEIIFYVYTIDGKKGFNE